jgi:hypothetical protein
MSVTTARPTIDATGSPGRRPSALPALLLSLHFYAGVLVAPS